MSKFALLIALALSTASAFATQYYGEAGDGYRPRCIHTGQRTNIFFSWNENEIIERTVWARRRALPCSGWRSSNSYLSVNRWETLRPYQDVVFGVRLSPQTVEALQQVRYGARLIRTESTADEFLSRRSLRDYSLATNRWLSATYGVGFSGEVYRSWINSQEPNRRVRALYRRVFESVMKDSNAAAALKARHSNVVVLVSMGMGWDKNKADASGDVGKFVNEIPNLGFPIKLLENYPNDDLRGNVGRLYHQLERELASGKDIVLLGLCKGSPELLAALALATRQSMDADRNQTKRAAGRGKVLAYGNLSGLVAGTYIADALKRVPLNQFIGPTLEQHGRGKAHAMGVTLNQLSTLSREELSRFNNYMWVNKVPNDVVYATAVGISGGKPGFRPLESPFINSVRKRANSLGVIHTANDGFIEYPGSELPSGTGRQQYTITFDASHMLWDGYFDEYYLNSPPMRRALFLGMIAALLELQ